METRLVPIGDLLRPKTLLRLVNTDDLEFLELRESIRTKGILQSLLVRPAAGRPGKYEIVDGLCRYTAALEVGEAHVPQVPIVIREVSDEEVTAYQVQSNAIGVTTKPCEYAKAMRRLLAANPDWDIDDLVRTVKKSRPWVNRTLELLNLAEEYQHAVNRGKMTAINAYYLAKLPPRLQSEYFEQACLYKLREWKPIAAAAIKAYGEAVRRGNLERFFEEDFQPIALLRTKRSIEKELKERQHGPMVLAALKVENPLDGFYAGLTWALGLDPRTIDDRRERFNRRREKSRSRLEPGGQESDDE